VIARDGKLIGAVALALFFLPGVVAGVIRPDSEGVPKSTSDILLVAVIAIIGLVGQLAIIRLALGTRSSVGEAIGHGVRRAPPYFVACLIWILPFAIAFYEVAGDMMENPAAATPSSAFGGMAILIALIIVSVRLLMSSSVASAEHVGPINILKRSWNLTRGNWWRIFAFLMIFLLATLVLLWVTGMLAGIVGVLAFGEPTPMSLSALFISFFVELATTVLTVGFLVMLARMYVQLAGPEVSVPSSGT
jgi:hypothetical protein